jgi:hypothetical protein
MPESPSVYHSNSSSFINLELFWDQKLFEIWNESSTDFQSLQKGLCQLRQYYSWTFVKYSFKEERINVKRTLASSVNIMKNIRENN